MMSPITTNFADFAREAVQVALHAISGDSQRHPCAELFEAHVVIGTKAFRDEIKGIESAM